MGLKELVGCLSLSDRTLERVIRRAAPPPSLTKVRGEPFPESVLGIFEKVICWAAWGNPPFGKIPYSFQLKGWHCKPGCKTCCLETKNRFPMDWQQKLQAPVSRQADGGSSSTSSAATRLTENVLGGPDRIRFRSPIFTHLPGGFRFWFSTLLAIPLNSTNQRRMPFLFLVATGI